MPMLLLITHTLLIYTLQKKSWAIKIQKGIHEGIQKVIQKGIHGKIWGRSRTWGREGSKTRKKVVTSFMDRPKQFSHDVDALRKASVEFLNNKWLFYLGIFFWKRLTTATTRQVGRKKNIKRFLKQFVVCLLKCGCMFVCLFDLSALVVV